MNSAPPPLRTTRPSDLQFVGGLLLAVATLVMLIVSIRLAQ